MRSFLCAMKIQRLNFLFFFLPFFLSSITAVEAQKQSLQVTGAVYDTTQQPLEAASIGVIKPPDSLFIGFSSSNEEGVFTITIPDTGVFEIQVSYLGFTTYRKVISNDGQQRKLNLDSIVLSKSLNLMNEVEVTSTALQIQMKEDTIEYNTAAFSIDQKDMVEDLLKKFPGLEVDEDGKITANGEEVTKILVDGEEFFSGDPKIATKNLPADAVDKVQVFDKKSEIAEFSGVDDGNEKKTINLKLKPERKRGYFGNLSLGYGSSNRYQSRVNLNRFSGANQLSFIGNFNNINQSGFDRGGFGPNQIVSGPMGRMSDGFNTAGSGGINFNRKYDSSLKIRSSYFLNQSKSISDSESNTQNLLTNEPFIEDQLSMSQSSRTSHRLNGRIEYDLDTMQSIRLSVEGRLSENESTNESSNEIKNFENELLSNSENIRSNERSNTRFDIDMLYRKKFNKKGRNFSLTTEFSGSDDESIRTTISDNNFFLSQPTPEQFDSVRQYELNGDDRKAFYARSTYREPVGEKKYLSLTYTHDRTVNNNFRDVFEFLPITESIGDPLVDLSNAYERVFSYHKGTLQYQIEGEKVQYRMSLSGQTSNLNGRITSDGSIIEKDFKHWLPSGSIRWKIDLQKHLRINYSTSVRAPSLNQLQPYIDNSDPLRVYIGNPDLLATYRHSLRINFSSFNPENSTNFYSSVSASLVENPIVTTKVIDSLFRQVTMPTNVDQSMSWRAYANYGTPIEFIGLQLNVNGNLNWSNSPVFINGVEDEREGVRTGFGLNLTRKGDHDFEYGGGWSMSRNVTQFEIDTSARRTFSSQQITARLKLRFLKRWTIGSNMNYAVYQGDSFEENQRVPIWNASVSVALLNNEQLSLRLNVFDLLAQNQGVNRSADLNAVSEVRVNSLSRYFMFSASYKLSRLGAK